MAGSQAPPASDPTDNPPTTHRVVDLPTEPTLQLPAAVAVAVKRDFNRQCKMANAIIPALLTISVTLIATIPSPVDPAWILLHSIDPALAFTSLIGSFALVVYSLSSHPGAELAKAQVIVLSSSAALLGIASLSRMTLHFPFRVVASMAVFPGLLLLALTVALKIKAYKKGN